MKSTSQKQIIANQKNSKKGGVKTNQGKLVSKFNARKHGILSNIVRCSEESFFNAYLEDLFDEYEPKGFTENILVERIAILYLKLYRLRLSEENYIKNSIDANFDQVYFHNNSNDTHESAIDEHRIEKLVSLYQRYETTIENRLYKAINELKKIQFISKNL